MSSLSLSLHPVVEYNLRCLPIHGNKDPSKERPCCISWYVAILVNVYTWRLYWYLWDVLSVVCMWEMGGNNTPAGLPYPQHTHTLTHTLLDYHWSFTRGTLIKDVHTTLLTRLLLTHTPLSPPPTKHTHTHHFVEQNFPRAVEIHAKTDSRKTTVEAINLSTAHLYSM